MMRIVRLVIMVGVALIVFGIIFQFQGRGVVGPESSFMYYNKNWIYYGIGIVIFGVMVCGGGIFAYIRTR